MGSPDFRELLAEAIEDGKPAAVLHYLVDKLSGSAANSVVEMPVAPANELPTPAPGPAAAAPVQTLSDESSDCATREEVWNAAADYLRTRALNARVSFRQIANAVERSPIKDRLDRSYSGGNPRNPVAWRKQISQYLTVLKTRGLAKSAGFKVSYILLTYPPAGDQRQLLMTRVESNIPYTSSKSIRCQIVAFIRTQPLGAELRFSHFRNVIKPDPGTVLDCNAQPSEFRPVWHKQVTGVLSSLIKSKHLKPCVPEGLAHKRHNGYRIVRHP
jgi:hypothetical protein